MGYHKIAFLSMIFGFQGLFCMKVEYSNPKYGNSFASSYFASRLGEPDIKTIEPGIKIKNLDANKAKEKKQKNNANLNLQKPVFNNLAQNGLAQNIPTNNTNAKKPWFGPLSNNWKALSNNWKAFLINMGTGVGSVLVDKTIPFSWLIGLYGYPALRRLLYKKSLVEYGKSYGDIIDKRVWIDRYDFLTHLTADKKKQIVTNDQPAVYDRIKTRFDNQVLIGYLTSTTAWVATHLLIDYLWKDKKPTEKNDI